MPNVPRHDLFTWAVGIGFLLLVRWIRNDRRRDYEAGISSREPPADDCYIGYRHVNEPERWK